MKKNENLTLNREKRKKKRRKKKCCHDQPRKMTE